MTKSELYKLLYHMYGEANLRNYILSSVPAPTPECPITQLRMYGLLFAKTWPKVWDHKSKYQVPNVGQHDLSEVEKWYLVNLASKDIALGLQRLGYSVLYNENPGELLISRKELPDFNVA